MIKTQPWSLPDAAEAAAFKRRLNSLDLRPISNLSNGKALVGQLAREPAIPIPTPTAMVMDMPMERDVQM